MGIQQDLESEMRAAEFKYGAFSSTHEALGVITEELHELIEAIHQNDPEAVRNEAIQLAGVCLRLADQIGDQGKFMSTFYGRSGF